MKKLMRTRTKSEGVQQAGFLTQSNPHSRTAYIKFKPFSQECTMINIEQKLQSFRYTMTHFRSATKSTLSDQPIMQRLGSIIKGGKGKRGKRRNLTDMDIHSENSSHNSHAILDAKLERMKRRSDTINKFLPTQYHEQKEKEEQPASIQVRQDLSQQAIQQENAFFDTMHRPVESVLLTNFNKSNYLFSRSKHKVMAQDLEKPRFQPPQQPIVSGNGKFASFSTYFYGGYMKKYKERRRLLSKKSTLAQIVAQ